MSKKFVASWEAQHAAWFRDSRGQHVQRFECDVCRVDCQSRKGLDAHLRGSKRCKKKRRRAAAEKAEKAERVDGADRTAGKTAGTAGIGESNAGNNSAAAAAAGGGGGGGGGGGSSGDASNTSVAAAAAAPAQKKRKKGRKEVSPLDLFRRHVGQCTGKKDLPGALRLFEENRASGVRANVHIYNALLYMCCNDVYGTREARNAAASMILADIDARGDFQFDEALYSIAIKMRCQAGYVSAAKNLLAAMKGDGWKPKRRTYAPIVESHAAQTLEDLRALNRLYAEAEADDVEFGVDEFCSMLKACVSATNEDDTASTAVTAAPAAAEVVAENGASGGVTETVEDVSSCEDFFERTLHRMKQLVPVASRAVLDVVREWSEQHSITTTLSKCTISIQEQAALNESGGAARSTTSNAGAGSIVSSSSSSAADAAASSSSSSSSSSETLCLCSACGASLHSIDLTPDQNAHILTQIATGLAHETSGNSSSSSSNNNNNNHHHHANNTGTTQFERFKSWVGRNFPRGVDYIIDGANVGFFGRRPPKERLSFEQIDRAVRAVTSGASSSGKRVLLILHQRHFKRLSERQHRLVEAWKRNRILYQTPHRMNDDWFWLYAAVYSSKYVHQPLVITNDQMRDHHFQMLSQRCFLKWRERHVVRFGFSNLYDYRVPPTFWFPLPYSTQIQGSGTSWHFPVRESTTEAGVSNKDNKGGGGEEVPLTKCEWYCLKTLPRAADSRL